MSDIGDLIDAQIDQQGVSVIRGNDNSFAFTFTTATLERLLASARGVGKVVVLVRAGAES